MTQLTVFMETKNPESSVSKVNKMEGQDGN